jgi:superfamily I DNA/RNA helicase
MNKPTDEQIDIIDKFALGGNLRINAMAGTGKTSTTIMIAESTQKRGVYLAFNKAIADEARGRFPGNIVCMTTHSMAYRTIIARGYSGKKLSGKMSGAMLAYKSNARGNLIKRTVGKEKLFYNLDGRSKCMLVVSALQRWQRSAHLVVKPFHVPVEGKLAKLMPEIVEEIRDVVAEEANRVWQQIVDPKSDYPLGHDGYLKLWALSNPEIPGDFIIVDEAQDTNAVTLGVIKNQTKQIVAVGDKNQAIYSWRGAENAMVDLPCDQEGTLSKSFRFGQEVADAANTVLRALGTKTKLIGNEKIDSSVISDKTTPTDAILYRTNARMIDGISRMLDSGLTPQIVGGTKELETVLASVIKLQNGQPAEYPPEFFGYNNWDEVRADSENSDDLKRWVALIEKVEAPKLLDLISNLPDNEDDADVTLTTGHKSKGREWPTIRLADDFMSCLPPDQDFARERYASGAIDEDLRLYYVAKTRARETLILSEETQFRMSLIGAQHYIRRDHKK